MGEQGVRAGRAGRRDESRLYSKAIQLIIQFIEIPLCDIVLDVLGYVVQAFP